MSRQARTALVAAALAVAVVSAAAVGASCDPRAGSAPDTTCGQTLVRAGEVVWKSSGTAGTSDLGGSTAFRFDDAFDCTCGWRVLEDPAHRRLVILPHIRAVVRLRHTVHLPGGIADTTGWWRRHRRHELDRVAISTDGRPRLLFTCLATRLDSVIVPLGRAALCEPDVGERTGSGRRDPRYSSSSGSGPSRSSARVNDTLQRGRPASAPMGQAQETRSEELPGKSAES